MNYIFLICPLFSLVICQIIKFTIEALKNKTVSLKRIVGSSGMPSSHSTFISSLTFIIGFKEGLNSSIFALAVVFMLITCYDAFNVRCECGKHAKILNKTKQLDLNENIGHNLKEVIVGIILGFIIALIFNFI